MKVLCIDIGNTNTKYAYFRDGECIRSGTLKTGEWQSFERAVSALRVSAYDKVMICSVVPMRVRRAKAVVKRVCGIAPTVVGDGCVIRLQTKYAQSQLGHDRAVNIWGALCSYQSPFIVVSFGTAITIDYVNPAGMHAGGVIMPGLETVRQSVHVNTAQLPRVRKAVPKSVYATTTRDAIASGTVFGIASAVDGIVARMIRKARKPVVVLGVGGDAAWMKKYCSSLTHVDEEHTLGSLCVLAYAVAVE